MRCQKCNAELLHENVDKCPYCGNIIHNHEMYKHGTITKCQNCQATVISEYENCPYCGKNMKNVFNFNNLLSKNPENNIKKIVFIFIGIVIFFQIIPIIFGIIMFIISMLLR